MTALLHTTARIAAADNFQILHGFGLPGDGAEPWGSLTLSGTTLYGMTLKGGDNDLGTIFKYDLASSTYARLYSFTGSATDGASPLGGLTIDGSTLYGTAELGGDSNHGVAFRFDLSAQSLSVMHSFGHIYPGPTDGIYPTSNLLKVGNLLYGTTEVGSSAYGVIYAINPADNSENVVYSFYSELGGVRPSGSPIQIGSKLYLTTELGAGNSNAGTVTSFDPISGQAATLHAFGAPGDGVHPCGNLLQSGHLLYGLTTQGGASNLGSIYSVDLNDNSEKVLFSFNNWLVDGSLPYGSLAQIGSVLYGMTAAGGSVNAGVIFSFDTATDTYSIVRDFQFSDGSVPEYTQLLAVGDTLYGMTAGAGPNGHGEMFALTVPEPTTLCAMSVGLLPLVGRRKRSSD